MKTVSVEVGAYFEDFIKTGIAQKHYNDISEVVHSGLRLLKEKETCIMELKTAIKEGIESGRAVGFDSQQYLQALKAKKNSL